MRTDGDPDLMLIERMLAPPPLEDARSSLEYWRRRRKALPVYRRAARREAKEMAGRWQERVREAELVLFEASLAGRVLVRLGVSRLWIRRMRFAREAMVWAAWAVLIRRMRLVARSLALGVLLVIAAVILINQL